MISVIVCSNKANLFVEFEKSVTETIGVEFEIIKIDNKCNKYGICEAYNLGASSAKFEYVCFAHEDILFQTTNWGLILYQTIKNDSKIGLIGVAGSKYKSLSPGGWPNGLINLDCYNLIQCYGNEKVIQIANPENGPIAEVKVLDGVFLFTKKTIWKSNQFDSKTFKGFHAYDLDFCLQIGKQYKLIICYQFLIEHRSQGLQNKEWMLNTILLSKKWNDYLPIGNLTHAEKKHVEWCQKRLFALKMMVCGFSIFKVLIVFIRFGFVKFFNLQGNISFLGEIIKSISIKFLKKIKIIS